jgi:hypothetical protein
MTDSRRKLNAADIKRINLREQLWPGSSQLIWDMGDKDLKGFATISRLMPWIMSLIDKLNDKGGAASTVYLELWCRDWGQSIISIIDEQECAYAAGYTGKRAHRTWKERMFKLVELKFIETVTVGNREFGHVLLLNPLAVCCYWRDMKRVPDEWWTSFSNRAAEIKAQVVPFPPLPSPPTPSTSATAATT